MIELERKKDYFQYQYRAGAAIIQIGAGGNGSLLAPYITRLMHSHESLQPAKKFVYIISDGDKVERKNINRQNFIECDINNFKSNVLAERYS